MNAIHSVIQHLNSLSLPLAWALNFTTLSSTLPLMVTCDRYLQKSSFHRLEVQVMTLVHCVNLAVQRLLSRET